MYYFSFIYLLIFYFFYQLLLLVNYQLRSITYNFVNNCLFFTLYDLSLLIIYLLFPSIYHIAAYNFLYSSFVTNYLASEQMSLGIKQTKRTTIQQMQRRVRSHDIAYG